MQMNNRFTSMVSIRIEYLNTLIIPKIDVAFEATRFRLYLNMTIFFINVYQKVFNHALLCLFCMYFLSFKKNEYAE